MSGLEDISFLAFHYLLSCATFFLTINLYDQVYFTFNGRLNGFYTQSYFKPKNVEYLNFNEKELYILENRLLNDEPLKLQQIGDKWGVSREAVRQMEARLMKKIKKQLVPE